MKKIHFVIVVLPFLIFSQSNPDSLRKKIENHILSFKGDVGLAILHLEKQDTFLFNERKHFPMQSVYKLPIAMAVLNEVDKGKLKLNQKIRVSKGELLPDTWSPLRDSLPNGGDIYLSTLLSFTVSKSDNNGCDILLRIIGGPKKAERYLRSIGIKNIDIVATEEEMHKDWDIQYKNFSEPLAMLELLVLFRDKKILSDASRMFLQKILIETSTGPNRLKGLLPKEAIVAHKTGTGAKEGFVASVNDVGIISLPDGSHIAIVVYVGNTSESIETCEKVIAQITKEVWEEYK
jgi:beta-lactamase class A